jgi:hypothetical protein
LERSPIEVAEIGESRADINGPYRVISDEELLGKYPGGADEVVTKWAELGPDRLTNK